MKENEKHQFEAMFKSFVDFIQRNDRIGVLTNALCAKHGVDLGECYKIVQLHNKALHSDMLDKCHFYTKCKYKDLPDCTVTKCRHYEPARR